MLIAYDLPNIPLCEVGETEKNTKTKTELFLLLLLFFFFLLRIRDWSWFVFERVIRRPFVEKDKLWSQKFTQRGRLWGYLTKSYDVRHGAMVMK